MPATETPAAAPGLIEDIRTRLHQSSTPLKLSEVTKGLSRPKKVKVADFQEEIRGLLDEEVRVGRAFCYYSGKNNVPRYWSRDEKQLLSEKTLVLAATPLPLSKLKTALGKELKDTDGQFLENIVRELVAADRLFEHPPLKANGAVQFGATAPPPPLEQPKHQKTLDKLAADCRKLMTVVGVPLEQLLLSLRARINKTPVTENPVPASPLGASSKPATEAGATPNSTLDELILKAVANSPVVSIADLRAELPSEFQGQAFEEAVLRLAGEGRVVVSQDVDPSRFSATERANFIQDGDTLFTTIMKGN